MHGMIPPSFHTRVSDRLNGRLRGVLTAVARPHARYLPGPRWWGRRLAVDGRRISGITQPPLAATCARLVFERHPEERRARALLRPLLAWHRFLLEERDPRGVGEPVLIHPWESGRDNAVEWDGPLWRVLREVTVIHRRDTDSVDAAERPSDEHYRRFLTLVRRGTAIGWDQTRLARSGQFRVLDPGFSAILARACLDLAELATELGESRTAEESHVAGARVAASLRARAGADGLIRAVDLIDGRRSAPPARAAPWRGPDAVSRAPRHARWRRRWWRAGSRLPMGCGRSPATTRSARRATTGAAPCGPTSPGSAPAGSRSTVSPRRPPRCVHGCSRRSRAAACASTSCRTPGRGLGTQDFTWTAALGLTARAAPGRPGEPP